MEVYQYNRVEFIYLLRWYVEGYSPEVYLSVGVYAGDDKEDARTFGAALEQPTQPEDNSSLVFLHHLRGKGHTLRHM